MIVLVYSPFYMASSFHLIETLTSALNKGANRGKSYVRIWSIGSYIRVFGIAVKLLWLNTDFVCL